MNEAQRNVALFRYSLIREAADESLTIRQRGALVRELASAEHVGPNGRGIKVGRGTIDRWIRVYRAGGFEALAPESHRRTGDREAIARPGRGAQTRGAPANSRPGGPDHPHC
jgi:putative transposase